MESFDDDWGRPVENSGEYARPELLAGHLLIVFPLGYVPFLLTKFTVPGKKSDAICCDVVDLDDKDEAGNAGKIYRTSNLMQARIIQDLKPFIGRKVLGRVGKGVSKNGMNPPWVITDMSADPALMERARAWAQANPNFVKSEFVPRDEAAPPAQAQANAPMPPALQGFAQPMQQGYGQGYGQQQQPHYADQYHPVPAAPAQGYAQPQQQQYPADQFQQAPYPQQPPPQYQQQPQQQAQRPQPQYAPVDGSAILTDGERSVLERMREQQNRRDLESQRQQQQAGFQDVPPF